MIPQSVRREDLDELDPKEAGRVVRAAQRGDPEARERLVLAHSRLVAKIVCDLAGRPDEDLFQEGVLGLLAALERYRPRYRTKFSTYATYWIRYFVQRAMAGSAWEVRVPIRRIREMARIRAAEERLAQRMGRAPSDAEVARSLGWKAARLAKVRRDALLLGTPAEVEGEREWTVPAAAAPSPVEFVIERETKETVARAIRKLSPAARQVVLLRYGLLGGSPATLAEVGNLLGISTEAARQAERRALARLRSEREIAAMRRAG